MVVKKIDFDVLKEISVLRYPMNSKKLFLQNVGISVASKPLNLFDKIFIFGQNIIARNYFEKF